MEKLWDILVTTKFHFLSNPNLEYPIPGTNNYPTIETKRAMRTGAEEEYHIRGELGRNLPKKKQKGYLDFFIPVPSSF